MCFDGLENNLMNTRCREKRLLIFRLIYVTLKLKKINGFRKHSFCSSIAAASIQMATSKIVKFSMNYMKGFKSVLALAITVLNQTLNIHIQNYLVESSSKKMK